MVCRTDDSGTQTQGQGHNLMSQDVALNLVSAQSAIQTQGQGQIKQLWGLAFNFGIKPLTL